MLTTFYVPPIDFLTITSCVISSYSPFHNLFAQVLNVAMYLGLIDYMRKARGYLVLTIYAYTLGG